MASRGRTGTDVDGVGAVGVGGVAVDSSVSSGGEVNDDGSSDSGCSGADSEGRADGGSVGGERGRSALNLEESSLVVEESLSCAGVGAGRVGNSEVDSGSRYSSNVQDVKVEGSGDGTVGVGHVASEVGLSGGVSSKNPCGGGTVGSAGDDEGLREGVAEESSSRCGHSLRGELVSLLLGSIGSSGYPEDEGELGGGGEIQDSPCVG